jgi:hypothetical protein
MIHAILYYFFQELVELVRAKKLAQAATVAKTKKPWWMLQYRKLYT